MDNTKIVGFVMILAGCVFLASGYVQGFVIITFDNTPPEFSLAEDGLPAVAPRDGKVYSSLDKVQAAVNDLESAVKSVMAEIDGSSYTMTLYIGDAYNGVWIAPISGLSSGTYHIRFTATNNVGLTSTYDGNFKIYTSLQGGWYVNGIEITDPSQHLYLTDTTVTFKFEKTSGISDENIVCTVEWVKSGTPPGSMLLTHTTAGVWEGTYAFTDIGTYTITLTAYDGTETITMNVFGLGVGQQEPMFTFPTVSLWTMLGLASAGIGSVLLLVPRRKT